MKTIKLLSILTIIFGFSQCGSLKFEKSVPFKITSATYRNWVGGLPGNTGKIVSISYTSNTDVLFDSIYFANKRVKLKAYDNKGVKSLLATLTAPNINIKKDIILHSNRDRELKNPIPELIKFPFKLKENEAVISFLSSNKIKYFKIKRLKEDKSIIHSSTSKQ